MNSTPVFKFPGLVNVTKIFAEEQKVTPVAPPPPADTQNIKMSPAKRILLHMLQTTQDNEEYKFQWPAEDAHRMVHRMRVELSRFRKKLKDRGKVVRKFKMMHISTTPISGSDQVEIVLTKEVGENLVQSEEAIKILMDLGMTIGGGN